MNLAKQLFVISTFLVAFASCNSADELKLLHVTKSDFKKFVQATNYVTDAEQYGWSIVQVTIDTFKVVDNAIWTKPDGFNTAIDQMPITQVSYRDALAYCKWANVRIPSYDEYWQLAKADKRKINISTQKVITTSQSNIIGNTWDITSTKNKQGEIRLAGGSYLCSKNSCDGTNPKRELYVSPETGNAHISFVVVF